MDTPDFDTIFSRRGSDSVKWNRYPEDVLPLWVADMDFPTPEFIIEAIRKRLDHPFFGYGSYSIEVIESICLWLMKRHNWQVEPEHILLMPGVVSGFHWAVHSLLKPGESFIFQTPVYPPFFRVADNASVQEIKVPFVEGMNQYEIDFDLIERNIQSNSSLFLLCNPHNPVGRVFTGKELGKLGEVCTRNNLWICSDEIHSDLVYEGSTHIPIASLSEEIAQRTITLMAPSKTFNIPGLHFSFAVVSNEEIREKMAKSKKGLLGYTGLLANAAAGAAYSNGEQWLNLLLKYLEGNRDLALNFFKERIPEIKTFKPEGTYLLWLDCSELQLNTEPYQFFLDKAKLGFNPGKPFGVSGSNHVRLNFGCPRSILEQALERMAYAIEAYRN
jgi:cystathionine beta-lyase